MHRRAASVWWFPGVLFAGAVLAIALMVQTVSNYRYVTESLIRQEARRTAEERVRGFERAVRVARTEAGEAYQQLLDEYRDDVAEQVASMGVMRPDGTQIALSGAALPRPPLDDQRTPPNMRAVALTTANIDGRESLIGVIACRCLPAVSASRRDVLDRGFVQIAVYRDSLSAPFARLRRNALISVSAAIALLLAVALIALRVGPYVRGKQLEVQLKLAREVQRALLPPPATWPAGVDAAAACVPASQVGGDFYEVQPLPDRQLAFSIGDVSGHGISAALLMSMMHGAMSNGAGTSGDPEQMLARLNELLLRKSSGERFASMISCVYDPRSGRLQYANAGHPPGLLFQRDDSGRPRVSRLAEGGPVLGVLADAAYRHTSVMTSEGDLLVLLSDGILEAMNRDDEFFGEGRVLDVIERHRDQLTGEICRGILAAVQTFCGSRPADDDRTVVVIRLWRTAADQTEAA